jgi:hypothetical protein
VKNLTLREKAKTHKEIKGMTPFQNTNDFELSQRIGKLINFSSLVQQEGSPMERLANAVVLQDLARTTNISIFTLAKEIYIVKGKVGFSAKFYRAVCNSSGEFTHRIRFKFNEDKTSCIAYTRDATDGELLESVPYTIAQAKQEGLFSKSGSKWLTRPDEMLCNRATTIFSNMYASHLFLGLEKYVKDNESNTVLNENLIEGELL